MTYFVSTNVGTNHFPTEGGGKDVRGTSSIIDYQGCDMATYIGAEETTQVSAIIVVEKLRADRRDTIMRNPIERLRFESYVPVYKSTVFYPANQFLETPMTDKSETSKVVEQSRANMTQIGAVLPE